MYKLKELVCGIGDEANGANECLIGYKLKELVYGIGDEAKGMNDCLIEYILKEFVCGPNNYCPRSSTTPVVLLLSLDFNSNFIHNLQSIS